MKLRTRLFALVVVTLLPIVGIEVYDEMEARNTRAEEGKDQALRLVRLVAGEQSKVAGGAHQLLIALAATPLVRAQDITPCSAFFADLVHSYPQYESLVSIDLDGHPVCTGGRTDPAAVVADRPDVRLAIANHGFAVGEYDAGSASHGKAIYLTQPYYGFAGQIGGVVAVGLSLDWLNREIARIPLPPKATVSVIDRQGTIVARYPGTEQFVGTKVAGGAHAYLLTGGEGVQEALGFDGVSRIYAYTQLPGGPPGLTVSVGLDKGEVLKGSQAANRRAILAIAGSLVLALLLAAVFARLFLGRPIAVLLDAADQWRQGKLDARVPSAGSRSEFGRLGAAFNAMAAAIGVREQELETRVAERTEALTAAMQAQQAAEAALHDSRKMETVGRLTGGVAHDFNNILAAIVGNIELARSRLAAKHTALPRLDAAMESAHRGAALVQQLLAFARRQNLRPEVVDLNRHVRGLRDMLQRLLRSDITVETSLSPKAWLVRVDPNQLEAAILNLAINARDAMPNGGILRLQTRNATVEAEGAAGGDFVALTVSDTGTGIAPEILENVFEPFFTTKEIGAGSGLGLSMVQGFVRQSSGSVAIDSIVGQGTSVTLHLPRTTEAASVVPVRPEPAVRGEGTILLVDDDAAVRTVTAELLELTGYSVITAHDAAEAIACFAREPDRIDVLVTDFVLANGMNGIELARVIQAMRPLLPVLLVTGYSEALVDGEDAGSIPVLTKPFDRPTLARAVLQTIVGTALSV